MPRGHLPPLQHMRVVWGDGSGMELMPEETVQGDRHEQLGAALRCVTTVETSAHGLMILAGGAKDVLLVARIAQPQLPPVAGGGRGAKQTGGKCKLLSTHRVPAAKGMMLRFMALEAFQHPRLGAHVLGVLAAADDGMIRLLFYHVVRKQWHIAGELRSLAPSPTLSPTDPVPRGLLTLGQAYCPWRALSLAGNSRVSSLCPSLAALPLTNSVPSSPPATWRAAALSCSVPGPPHVLASCTCLMPTCTQHGGARGRGWV